jgi:hypothetical protein
MAKRRFRIDSGRYGGELVLGEVDNRFARQFCDEEESEIIDFCVEADSIGYEEDSTEIDEHEDPERLIAPKEDYYMWECDEFEHLNSCYSDGGFMVYEVAADGSDDWNCDAEVGDYSGICVYSREGALFGNEEPDLVSEQDDDGNHYVPVLLFHSAEKGNFGSWFVDTDEDFDQYKLGFGQCETNVGEFVDRLYYDKKELEQNYDYNDSTGKGYYASVGWLNTKWHDSFDQYGEGELDADYWSDFDDNAQYERENN